MMTTLRWPLLFFVLLPFSCFAAEKTGPSALEQAKNHESKGRFAEAISLLEPLLSAEEEGVRVEVRFRIGEDLFHLGKNQEALERLEPLVSGKGGLWAQRARQLYADLQERAGQPSKAIHALRLLVAYHTDDFSKAEAALRLGRLLNKNGSFDEAQTTLLLGLQALRGSSESEFPQGRDLLAQLRQAMDALNKAREIEAKGLARVLWEHARGAYFRGKYPTVRDLCAKLRALPALSESISEGLDALELAMRWREAKSAPEKWALHEDFKRLLSLHPSGTFRGHLVLLEGDWLLMNQFRLSEAEALFYGIEPALRVGTDLLKEPGWCESVEALWMRIGLCHYMDRNFQEAEEAFTLSMPFKPEAAKAKVGIPSGFQNLIELCRQRRLATPEDLLTKGSDRGRILTAMADAYFTADRYGEARQIYERFRTDPDFKSESYGHRAHAQFMEARCLYQELETPKALLLLADFAGPYRQAPEAPAALFRFAVFMNTHEQIDPRNAKAYQRSAPQEKAKGPEPEKPVDADRKKVGQSKLTKYPREWVDRDVIEAFLAVRRAFPGTEEGRMAVVQLGAMYKWRGNLKMALQYFEEARQILADDSRWTRYLDESCIQPLRTQLKKENKP